MMIGTFKKSTYAGVARQFLSVLIVLLVVFLGFAFKAIAEDNKKPALETGSTQSTDGQNSRQSEVKESLKDPVPPATPNPDMAIRPASDDTCGQFIFDASGSFDPDSPSLYYQWDFGDGHLSSEPVVRHTYEKSGQFDVMLTLSDNMSFSKGSTKESSETISVHVPPRAAFYTPSQVCADEEVNFIADLLDPTQKQNPEELTFTWDFGDGTIAQGRTLRRKFSGGNYDVILMVDDNQNTNCSKNQITHNIHVNEPPVADAGEDIVRTCISSKKELTVHFDASGSYDMDKDPLTYLWDFGDGTMSREPKPTHTYGKSGRYEPILTVMDNSNLHCRKNQDKLLVHLLRAPKAVAGPDLAVCVGEPVNFDGTPSFAEDIEVLFSKWEFGDGKKQRGLKVQHTYDRVGQYEVSLIVEYALSRNCPSSTAKLNVHVNARPFVQLKPVPTTSCVGKEIFFDASDSGDPDGNPLEYFWSFGDGTILKGGPQTSHRYRKGGAYDVKVAVDDNQNSECSSIADSIQVKVNSPPVADPGKNAACCVGEFALFDASGSYDADGDPLKYYWEFGDGTMAYQSLITHAYDKSGEYRIFLTVDDESGTDCSIAVSQYVTTIRYR